jgi:DNA modification methylase
MIDLRFGDCLELMKNIEPVSVDAIITDPPYGTTACKWDSVIDLGLMWDQLNRIIKPNGAIVLFGSEPFSSALRMSNIKNYKYDWIWEKSRASNFATAKHNPMKYHENISVFYKNKPPYNPQMVLGKSYKTRHNTKRRDGGIFGNANLHSSKENKQETRSFRYPSSVVKFGSMRQQDSIHPTQKPIDLIEYLIKTYTNEGELVLDFTMGSGTTGVACKNLNRNFIGIEKDENYFEIATNRINN